MMKEDFLHYVWRFKKFQFDNLFTVKGEKLLIIDTGQYLQNSGPDFFNGQIVINNQKWAGNIEIHVNSSDWFIHNHQNDNHYDNVILHVVWNYDSPVYSKDENEIPVLELKHYVDVNLINNYESLNRAKSWIFCENLINSIDEFTLNNFQEKLYVERLEVKSQFILDTFQKVEKDWEATLFLLIAKNLGSNTNGQIFFDNLSQISFGVFRKEMHDLSHLEALIFGLNGLLEDNFSDLYFQKLKSDFIYLKQKHQLKDLFYTKPQFFKLRPENFPSIRLAHLAFLYHSQTQLFSKIIQHLSLDNYKILFKNGVSNYWENHYHFDNISRYRKRIISDSFVQLLMINTIIPVIYTFHQMQNSFDSELIFEMINKLLPEKNNIIDKFSFFGIKSTNALQTQALLHLKNSYCDQYKCLQCNIGITLLKNHNVIN